MQRYVSLMALYVEFIPLDDLRSAAEWQRGTPVLCRVWSEPQRLSAWSRLVNRFA